MGRGTRAPKTRNTKRSRDLGGGPQPVLVSDLGNCRPPKKQHTDARVPAATIGLPLPKSSLKLQLPHYCQHCYAKKFESETLHFCCGDGDIEIAMNEYPPELVRLFTSQEEDALHFRKYVILLFDFSCVSFYSFLQHDNN